MKIKIPEGESCQDCVMLSLMIHDDTYMCSAFKECIHLDFVKCPQCLNHEPVIVEYEGKKEYENKTE